MCRAHRDQQVPQDPLGLRAQLDQQVQQGQQGLQVRPAHRVPLVQMGQTERRAQRAQQVLPDPQAAVTARPRPLRMPRPYHGTLLQSRQLSYSSQTPLAELAPTANPTNLVAGTTYTFKVIQDNVGSRLVTWGSVFKWPNDTAPVLTTVANRTDLFTFYYDGTYLLGALLPNFNLP